jgi:putative nucleotidyltransferase with HDIG domain
MFSLFIACALLPVCALAVVSLWQVVDNSRNESLNLLKHTSKNIGMTINEILSMLQDKMESLTYAGKEITPSLHEFGRETGTRKKFHALTIFDGKRGARNIYGSPCPYPPLTAAASKHLADGKMLFFLQDGEGGTGRMLIATALDKDNPEKSLLVGEINADYLWEMVGYTLPLGTNVCILGSGGKLLYSSLSTPPGFITQVLAKLGQSSVGNFQGRQGGENYLVSYWSLFLKKPFCAEPLTVVASQSTHDAFKSAGKFARTFYLVVFLTLLVVIFVSSIQIRRNLVPLTVLRDGAHEISQGNFDHRVAVASGDEFEILAESFNDMSAHLKKHFQTLSEMGRIVRMILAGHNEEKIVDTVMANLRAVISCEWVCVSLTDPMILDLTQSSYSLATAGSEVRISAFSSEEMAILQGTSESFHVQSGDPSFSTLIAPMASEGARGCYLVPIFLKNSLSGVLTLGYRHHSEHIREDLLRGRQIADQIAVALENVHLIEELNLLNVGTIRALANAVDAKSPWTAGHSWRVTSVALNIGREIGLSVPELETLQKGGLFHDIGKIGVPESILDKPGKLTDEEYATIRKHPEIGAEIMGPIKGYQNLIPIVLQHHEWFNGKGYPHGLAGDAISLGARILAVADVYDALISDRPYRPGWEYSRVISFLEENSGSQFDPAVVQTVLKFNDRMTLENAAVKYQHVV